MVTGGLPVPGRLLTAPEVAVEVVRALALVAVVVDELGAEVVLVAVVAVVAEPPLPQAPAPSSATATTRPLAVRRAAGVIVPAPRPPAAPPHARAPRARRRARATEPAGQAQSRSASRQTRRSWAARAH